MARRESMAHAAVMHMNMTLRSKAMSPMKRLRWWTFALVLQMVLFYNLERLLKRDHT
jgi:hypothetical protein